MVRRNKKSLLDIFNRYNRKYFGSKIKLSALKIVRANFSGETQFYDNALPSISVSNKILGWGRYVRIVLLHEMVHASLPWYAYHGPKFKRRIRKLVKQGAYDDLL